jgi:predicted nucleotidyltransferase
MRLENYSSEIFKKEVLAIVQKNLDLSKYKLFFFGSRVRGDNFERADIDIGLEGDQPVPVSARFAIEDKLELLPMLYKIDLVDFSQVTPDFKKEALKNIEYVG